MSVQISRAITNLTAKYAMLRTVQLTLQML